MQKSYYQLYKIMRKFMFSFNTVNSLTDQLCDNAIDIKVPEGKKKKYNYSKINM